MRGSCQAQGLLSEWALAAFKYPLQFLDGLAELDDVRLLHADLFRSKEVVRARREGRRVTDPGVVER